LKNKNDITIEDILNELLIVSEQIRSIRHDIKMMRLDLDLFDADKKHYYEALERNTLEQIKERREQAIDVNDVNFWEQLTGHPSWSNWRK
jgi:hypothetical protein